MKRRNRWYMGISWLDVRLGFRMLVKHPGLTFVGGLALACGIGLGAAGFGFSMNSINATLPFEEGERIVALENWNVEESDVERRSLHDFAIWREQLSSFEGLAAYTERRLTLRSEDGRTEPVSAAEITASAFDIVRVPPLLGRPLVEADQMVGAEPVALIGYSLWQTHFGADPDVLGRRVGLDGVRRVIVGVMPEGFSFPQFQNAWLPLSEGAFDYGPLEGPRIRIVGRLAPGVGFEQAQTELSGIGGRLAVQFPATHESLRPEVVRYTSSYMTRGSDGMFYLMELVVLMLLVVACANVGNLVLARTATRSGEIAVRSAMGASRTRIVTQFFMETLVLALVSAVVGIVVANWGMLWLEGRLHPVLPFWVEMGLSGSAVLFGLGLAVLSALVAGVIPALKATAGDVKRGLGNASAGGGVRFGKLSTTLVVLEVALSVAFLAGAVALGKGLLQYRSSDLGFDAEQYIAANLAVGRETPASGMQDDYEREWQTRLAAIQQELTRRLEAEPGVSDVTFTSRFPGQDHTPRYILIEGIQPPSGGHRQGHRIRTARVDPSYFEALGVPVLSGRTFTNADRGTPVVTVNESFVRQHLGGLDPVGRSIRYADAGDAGRGYEIVGVVPDLGMNLARPAEGAGVYHPMRVGSRNPTLVLARVAGGPESFTPRLQVIVTEVEATMRVNWVGSAEDAGWAERLFFQVASTTFGALAAMALFLSTAGIFALMAFTVSQRTREIGIRSALGAQPSRIVAGIISTGVLQLGLGVTAGGALGYGLLGVLNLLPFDVVEGGPGVLASAASLMLVVGMIACSVPAGRGLRIQPTEALREGG